MSLPDADVEFLDDYARAQGVGSRSAVVRKAVDLLRASDLTAAYEETWQEWSASGDESLWRVAVRDAIA